MFTGHPEHSEESHVLETAIFFAESALNNELRFFTSFRMIRSEGLRDDKYGHFETFSTACQDFTPLIL